MEKNVKYLMLCLLIWLPALPLVGAERLVSAGGSLTEIVYALNAQHLLVGVDSSSQYPRAATELPDVGYFRALNVEGVLSVKPSQLLLLQGAGPQSVLDQLKGLGIATTYIDNPKTVVGLISTIHQVADAIGYSERGRSLSAQVTLQLNQQAEKPSVAGKTVVFLMSAGERGLIAAGRNTNPQLIFEQLALSNPFASFSGYKPVSVEALAASGAQMVLLASHTSKGANAQGLCQSAQMALWAKKTGCNLHIVDSLLFLGLTPRLPQAIQQTRQLLINDSDK